jgi:hypothetical protein
MTVTSRKEKKILSECENSLDIDEMKETLLEMKEKGYTQVELDTKFLDQWDEEGSVYLVVI